MEQRNSRRVAGRIVHSSRTLIQSAPELAAVYTNIYPKLMSQLPTLPLELVCEIVEESITVPEFLDPSRIREAIDPLTIVEHSAEAAYWEVERHRNVLRRVCTLFNVHLRKFKHRYVKMADINHGHVPEQALYSAIRVDCGDTCDMEGYSEDHCQDCLVNWDRRPLSSLTNILGDSKLPTQILTGPSDWQDSLVFDTLVALYKNMPYLKVVPKVVASEDVREDAFVNVMNFLSDLQFMSLSIIRRSFVWSLVRAPNLNTFVCHNGSELFPSSMTQWELPALRHLYLSTACSNFLPQKFIPVLQKFGYQLRTLRLRGRYTSKEVVPKDYWDLCPRLERLHINFSFFTPPPEDHPLHTIKIFPPHKYLDNGRMEFLAPFQMSFLTWPALQRVIVEIPWVSFDKVQSVQDWIQDCAVTCKRKGIAFEDSRGMPFDPEKTIMSTMGLPRSIARRIA